MPHSPLLALLVAGLTALLALIASGLSARSGDECPEKLPKFGCAYEVVRDGVCLGTFFVERPETVGGILRKAGVGEVAHFLSHEGTIPCGTCIGFSRKSAAIKIASIPGRRLLAAGIKIDVNLADEIDLAAVPGVGPVLAERIVSNRQSRSGFTTILELREIRGIGKKKLRALAEHVSIGSSRSICRFTMATDPLLWRLPDALKRQAVLISVPDEGIDDIYP